MQCLLVDLQILQTPEAHFNQGPDVVHCAILYLAKYYTVHLIQGSEGIKTKKEYIRYE